MKSFFGLFLILCLAACSSKSTKKAPEPGDIPLTNSKISPSPAFNRSFLVLMNAYFDLKNSFIAVQDSGIDHAARQLKMAADSLAFKELKADCSLVFTARTYSEGIASELTGLIGENDLLAKRKSFQMVSDQLYDLVRTVQFDQLTLYHVYCESAFDDQGAFWLCIPSDKGNPYIPAASNNCYAIKDSIVAIKHP